ncbi:PAS-domain containing protein, partial [Escherichia coli]|uniref:PAS-domain containing protein n=1 Tax=Escherichia coli TaxID=562 RepID=UPI0039E023C6
AHVVLDAIRENGVLTGFAEVARDITRQRSDAEQIHGLALILDLALSNMSQALCLFDAGQRVRLLNRRFFELFAIAEGTDLIGTP